ncbi:MAG: leucine-rich repeat domain-containing protein, partial [Acutalibacteraceae bacterium]
MKKHQFLKRFLACVMVVIMTLTAAPLSGFVGIELGARASATGEITQGDFTYEVNDDGTATITDVDEDISGDILIPSTLGGYTVTVIGDDAFKDCDELTSVTIPNSIVTISKCAFYRCHGLEIVTISDSVTTIGDYAFHDTALYYNEENWENGVLYIGKYLITAGYWNSLGDCVIREGTKLIADWAFGWCKDFTSVTIPDSVTTIGKNAFYSCDSLESVTIGNGVATIGEEAFEYCESLMNVAIGNSVTVIEKSAFENCRSLTSLKIPNSVSYIGSLAFRYCSNLESVFLGDSVTSVGYDVFEDTALYNNEDNWENNVLYIGKYLIKAKESISGDYTIKNETKLIADYAFQGCNDFKSVAIGSSVTSIGNCAFRSCGSLANIEVNVNNQNYSSADGVLFNKYKTVLIQYPIGNERTAYTIPDSVTTIMDSAFEHCESLASVIISNSATTIEENAFSCCDGLRNITIPNSVTTIGKNAFYNCESLTSVTIGNRITTISDDVFCECYNLESVTLGNSVKTVGEHAFYQCNRLESVMLPDSVTTIGYSAFRDCDCLKNVIFGNSVETVGEYAFFDCNRLESVMLPGSVTTIDEHAFGRCYSLKKIEVNESNPNYSSADSILFNKNKTKLIQYPIGDERTSYEIPDSVTIIGNSAFAYSNLESIRIGNSVTTIGRWAFEDSKNISNITIGSNVSSIGDWAFYDTALYNNEENWENDVLYIEDYLIQAKSSISGDYIVKEGTRLIASEAFRDCPYITSVMIGNGIITIGDYAFWNCESLENIIIPVSVITVGKCASSGCDNLTDIYYGGSEEQWNNIIIGDENDYIKHANIHFNHVIC